MEGLQITAYFITPNCRKGDETGGNAVLSIVNDIIAKIARSLSVEENKSKTIKITLTLLNDE